MKIERMHVLRLMRELKTKHWAQYISYDDCGYVFWEEMPVVSTGRIYVSDAKGLSGRRWEQTGLMCKEVGVSWCIGVSEFRSMI